MNGAIPKDTLAEILIYLAEKEHFDSLKDFGSVSRTQLVQALKELAQRLKQEAGQEVEAKEMEKLQKEIKKPYQEIVAKLPEEQRERLLKGFLN